MMKSVLCLFERAARFFTFHPLGFFKKNRTRYQVLFQGAASEMKMKWLHSVSSEMLDRHKARSAHPS
jgi:hypothetical protein